jgi:DinB superfamily
MTRSEIISLLKENHQEFIRAFDPMDERQFNGEVLSKWNPSQQLDHIIRAVKPVVLAFALPSFLLKLFFGKANRPSKTYDGLVEKYNAKLAAGGRASGRFIPKRILFSEKEKTTKKLNSLVQKLSKKIDTSSEKQLDELLLPHPLLGKLTLREMLYFTAYHAEHHRLGMVRNLETLVLPQQ